MGARANTISRLMSIKSHLLAPGLTFIMAICLWTIIKLFA